MKPHVIGSYKHSANIITCEAGDFTGTREEWVEHTATMRALARQEPKKYAEMHWANTYHKPARSEIQKPRVMRRIKKTA